MEKGTPKWIGWSGIVVGILVALNEGLSGLVTTVPLGSSGSVVRYQGISCQKVVLYFLTEK